MSHWKDILIIILVISLIFTVGKDLLEPLEKNPEKFISISDLFSVGKKEVTRNTQFEFISEKIPESFQFSLPAKVIAKLNKTSIIYIDDKKVIIKEKPIILENFTGKISFTNLSIEGKAKRIELDDTVLEGEKKLSIKSLEFFYDTLTIEGIEIGNLVLREGDLKIEKPYQLNAKINNTVIFSNFKGKIVFKANGLEVKGLCSRIQTSFLEVTSSPN